MPCRSAVKSHHQKYTALFLLTALTISSILTAPAGSPSKGVFQEMTGEKESRFPFRKGVTQQLPLASYSAKPPAGKGQTPPSTDTADIKVTMPLRWFIFTSPKPQEKGFLPRGRRAKRKREKEEERTGLNMGFCFLQLGCEVHIQSWHPGQICLLWGWVPSSRITPRALQEQNLWAVLLGDLQTVYKFTEDVKAFRCFWPQMPVAHTYKPHSSSIGRFAMPHPAPSIFLSRNKLPLLS